MNRAWFAENGELNEKMRALIERERNRRRGTWYGCWRLTDGFGSWSASAWMSNPRTAADSRRAHVGSAPPSERWTGRDSSSMDCGASHSTIPVRTRQRLRSASPRPLAASPAKPSTRSRSTACQASTGSPARLSPPLPSHSLIFPISPSPHHRTPASVKTPRNDSDRARIRAARHPLGAPRPVSPSPPNRHSPPRFPLAGRRLQSPRTLHRQPAASRRIRCQTTTACRPSPSPPASSQCTAPGALST